MELFSHLLKQVSHPIHRFFVNVTCLARALLSGL